MNRSRHGVLWGVRHDSLKKMELKLILKGDVRLIQEEKNKNK